MELEKSHEQVKGCDEISILSAGIYNNKPAATVRTKAIYNRVLSTGRRVQLDLSVRSVEWTESTAFNYFNFYNFSTFENNVGHSNGILLPKLF